METEQRKTTPSLFSIHWTVPAWVATFCGAIALGWVAWVSSASFWTVSKLQQGERFTAAHGQTLDTRITALEERDIPPVWFAYRVSTLEHQLDDITDKVRALEDNNRKDSNDLDL